MQLNFMVEIPTGDFFLAFEFVETQFENCRNQAYNEIFREGISRSICRG